MIQQRASLSPQRLWVLVVVVAIALAAAWIALCLRSFATDVFLRQIGAPGWNVGLRGGDVILYKDHTASPPSMLREAVIRSQIRIISDRSKGWIVVSRGPIISIAKCSNILVSIPLAVGIGLLFWHRPRTRKRRGFPIASAS